MPLGLQRGALFAGRYRVVRRLGSGAMGSVYEVLHLQTERLCALKIMHAHIVERAEMRERFRLEAKVAARVGSEYIVDVLDAGVDDATGTPFFVMERLKGEDLSRRLKRVGHLAPAEAVTYLHQVSIALDRMHQASIVHRDLKPANLFLAEGPDGRPRVKVLDFGVAKFITEASGGASTAIAGTPLYMSPEQCRGGKVTTAADVYAFGMIAYTLLVGEAYFADEFAHTSNLVAFAMATVKGPVEVATVRAAARDVALPAAFDTWFSVVTNVDPTRRFSSAGEAVRALAIALELPPLPEVSQSMPPPGPISVAPDSQGPTELAEDAAEWMGATATAEGAPGETPDTRDTQDTRDTRDTRDARDTAENEGGASVRGSQLSAVPHVTDAEKLRHASATQLVRTSRRWVWIGAAAMLATAADLTLGWHHRSEPERAVVASPLAAASAVIACPIFEAAGVPEPAGWLGAAAAGTVCERARVILGGSASRTLVPAELLSLPAQPVDHFPKDPYADADARTRSLDAARKRAAAYVDGQVAKEPSGFRITLALHRADGGEIARTEGQGRALYEAVRNAMDPLVTAGELPKAAALDPTYAEWSRAKDVDSALALLDVTLAITHNAGTVPDECAKLANRDADIAEMKAMDQWLCAYTLGVASPPVTFPPLDPTASPGGLAARARLQHMALHIEDPLVLSRLREDFERESTPLGRSVLAATLSCLNEGSQPKQAEELAHVAVQTDPKNTLGEFCYPWGQLFSLTRDTASSTSVIDAAQAWQPWDGNAWLASSVGGHDARYAIIDARRAYVLTPSDAFVVDVLAGDLLAQGGREEVRSMAITMGASGYPVQRVESDLLLVRVDASIARFGIALARGLHAMDFDPNDAGFVRQQRLEIAWHALEIGLILDRASQVADRIVERFVDPEPSPLDRNHITVALRIPAICVRASEAVSKRCFARFRALRNRLSELPETEAFTDGAERYARGDLEGAAKVWKPLLREPGLFAQVLSDSMETTFERTGNDELVQRLESIDSSSNTSEYNGATLADVRAARRAARHGDATLARTLARKVVDAWSVADEPVPAVVEMRKLLAALDGGAVHHGPSR